MSPEREPMENDSNSRTAEELEQQTVDVYVERALHGPVFRMLPENARQLLQPYSTLANLLLALNEYDESITNYSHVLWLMKENGYTEDSFAFHEFTDRINEVRQLKAQAAATE